MTLGVITPLEGFRGAVPTLERHAELVVRAEEIGVATVWVRDVPLVDPVAGDAGQTFEPFTYLGYLAARTRRIALGTASSVVTLRHPIDVAKAAASADVLSDGRLLLGIAGGDRPTEFPAYGIPYESRSELLRESLRWIRSLTEETTPQISSPLGRMQGIDLLPKPVSGRLPVFMTGRSGQEIDWIAENADGWLFYTLPIEQQALNIRRWRRLTRRDDGVFKPFHQATYLDLTEDPTAPAQQIPQGLRLGREPLLEHLEAWQEIGVDQLMLNFSQSRRPVTEVLEELAEHVLPHFPAGPADDEEDPSDD